MAILLLVLVLAAAGAVMLRSGAGFGGNHGDRSADADDAASAGRSTDGAPPATLRIVSLSPALTRMAVDLGAGAAIVGRSSFCTDVDASLPVAGDLMMVDYERLLELRPTLILRQAPRDEADARLTELARRREWNVLTVRSLDGLADIRQVLGELARAITRDDAAPGARAAERAAQLEERMERALAPPPGGFRGGVLLLHSIDPAGVFGRGSYLGDVLEALGAQNVAPVERWGSMSLEDIVRLDPDAIVLVRSGADPAQPERAFGPLLRLDLAAVRDGRLGVLTADGAMMPSTAVIGAAQELSVMLQRFARTSGASP